MKKLFPGYYRPTEDEFKKLWANCVFILDANVLLNLYRYPQSAREDLLGIIQKVSGRLWIPYQAALEYQQNRLEVIADQNKKFSEARKVIDDIDTRLKSQLNQLQLTKRHASINPESFLKKAGAAFNEFRKELSELETSQLRVYEDDKLRETIEALIGNKVGHPPKDQAYLDSLYKEGQDRYDKQIPPGFMDSTKKKSGGTGIVTYGGLVFKQQFGDFVLWKQILEEARERSLTHIIFVTNDEKEDWWQVVDSQGDKIIGPRPELVEEISRESGTTLFYMYNCERFMEMAKNRLAVRVQKESLDQVRDIAELNRRIRQDELGAAWRHNETEIMRWLLARYPGNLSISNPNPFVDFIVETERGGRIGFDIEYLNDLTIENISNIINMCAAGPNLTEVNLILIYEPGNTYGLRRFVRDVQRVIFGGIREAPYNALYIGHVRRTGAISQFVPLWKCQHGGAEFVGPPRERTPSSSE